VGVLGGSALCPRQRPRYRVATPKGPKPWLLYTEKEQDGRPVQDKVQEIGAGTPEAARHAAELWLNLAKLCRG
jgi:hypothetical protein